MILEDEEIGLVEVSWGRKSYLWVQFEIINYSYDNELSIFKEMLMEFKVFIVMVDVSDLEYDFDFEEDYSGLDIEKLSEEIIVVSVVNNVEIKLGDFFIYDDVIENGVIDKSDEEKEFGEVDLLVEVFVNKDVIVNGDLDDVLNFVNGEEMNFKGFVIVFDKIIYLNDGVIENCDMESDYIIENCVIESFMDVVGVEEVILKKFEKLDIVIVFGVIVINGNNVVLDNIRFVKIVKKIKIVVRKEVKVIKDEKVMFLSFKKLIGDFDNLMNCKDKKEEKVDVGDEIFKKDVNKVEVILEGSEVEKYFVYNFVMIQIGLVSYFMQFLNFVEGQYNIF